MEASILGLAERARKVAATPEASGASRGGGGTDHAAGFSALATSRKSALRAPLDFLGGLQAGRGMHRGVELLEGDARLQETS